MRIPQDTSNQSGFTVIEIMTTIFIAGLFIVLFLEMGTNLNSINASIKRQSLANDTAYSLLKKYSSPDVPPSSWFVCDTVTGSSNDNDRAVNVDAPGSVIDSGSLTSDETGLPSPITYSVNALALYGCAGVNSDKPIRVTVNLSYGTHSETVTHTVLVGY